MNLKSLKMVHFRNYSWIDEKQFSVLNVLYGDNGSGKTNFLEAIFLLSSTKPLRSGSLNDLINWDHDYFFLKGEFDSGVIEMGFSPEKKTLKLDQNPVGKNELRVLFPVLALLPEDLSIITGTPEDKRTFLDFSISLLDEEYTLIWRRYHRALKQRNAQLKVKPRDAVMWNAELIKWGTVLIRKRTEMVKTLNSEVSGVYRRLYGSEMSIRYLNNFKQKSGDIETSFRTALENSFPVDTRRKFTTIGPHRDSYNIVHRGHEGKSAASHGQIRCMALGMKIALANNIAEIKGVRPILLVDDVLLELDPERKLKMMEMISPHFQCFITVNDPQLLPDLPEHKVFYIESGTINKTDQDEDGND